MSEYIFRDAPGFGCDMSGYMDDGRTVIGEFYAKHSTDHYGTIHEEVVRCRDCKYGIDGGEYCAEDCADSWDWRCVEPDGFCAWGERK